MVLNCPLPKATKHSVQSQNINKQSFIILPWLTIMLTNPWNTRSRPAGLDPSGFTVFVKTGHLLRPPWSSATPTQQINACIGLRLGPFGHIWSCHYQPVLLTCLEKEKEHKTRIYACLCYEFAGLATRTTFLNMFTLL